MKIKISKNNNETIFLRKFEHVRYNFLTNNIKLITHKIILKTLYTILSKSKFVLIISIFIRSLTNY